jgi:hypothetical protein
MEAYHRIRQINISLLVYMHSHTPSQLIFSMVIGNRSFAVNNDFFNINPAIYFTGPSTVRLRSPQAIPPAYGLPGQAATPKNSE